MNFFLQEKTLIILIAVITGVSRTELNSTHLHTREMSTLALSNKIIIISKYKPVLSPRVT